MKSRIVRGSGGLPLAAGATSHPSPAWLLIRWRSRAANVDSVRDDSGIGRSARRQLRSAPTRELRCWPFGGPHSRQPCGGAYAAEVALSDELWSTVECEYRRIWWTWGDSNPRLPHCQCAKFRPAPSLSVAWSPVSYLFWGRHVPARTFPSHRIPPHMATTWPQDRPARGHHGVVGRGHTTDQTGHGAAECGGWADTRIRASPNKRIPERRVRHPGEAGGRIDARAGTTDAPYYTSLAAIVKQLVACHRHGPIMRRHPTLRGWPRRHVVSGVPRHSEAPSAVARQGKCPDCSGHLALVAAGSGRDDADTHAGRGAAPSRLMTASSRTRSRSLHTVEG